jgi:hypothetical protein
LHAQDPAGPDTTRAQTLDSLVARGRYEDLIGTSTTASEGRTGRVDLLSRPLSRVGELLETVPGVILTQHSGDGKGNQMFVRGFNLDHGTDFQTQLEGMPVNLPTHAHGQGYTDLNFIIPELVDVIDYKLGVYYAEQGDFSSAGGAQFRLLHRMERPLAAVTTGSFGFLRAVAAGSVRAGSGNLLVGGEARGYDGPWVRPQELRHFSGLARYTWDKGPSQFSLLGMAYTNNWDASDQIPTRAVDAGLISRFGQIDSALGGQAQRYSLSGTWRRAGASSLQDLQVYGIYSKFNLYSNFTYLLSDPTLGDQFNQRENRTIAGLNARHAQELQAFGRSHQLTLGLQSRADFINDVGLYQTADQVRVGTVRRDDVTQWSNGLHGELQTAWSSRFRSTLGLRGDVYLFDVTSDLPENSGQRTDGIVSPKLSLAWTPSRAVELYAAGGFGFHSNDARGTTIVVDPSTGDPAVPVDPLVRSRGVEFGARATPLKSWRSTLAVWALSLDSELLFVGDGGTTEPSFPSRRSGVTWTNFYRPVPQLSLDLDISLAYARFADVPDDESRIPGALENVVAAGVTWQAAARGLFGSARVRHFGAYPLIEDNSVRATPTTLLNAEVGYLFSGVRLQATVLNVLDTKASDIQYFYESRLQGEAPEGVGDVHFHPVEPRQLRVSLNWGL